MAESQREKETFSFILERNRKRAGVKATFQSHLSYSIERVREGEGEREREREVALSSIEC